MITYAIIPRSIASNATRAPDAIEFDAKVQQVVARWGHLARGAEAHGYPNDVSFRTGSLKGARLHNVFDRSSYRPNPDPRLL